MTTMLAAALVAFGFAGPAAAPRAPAFDHLSWSDVVASYDKVRDYTALYAKEERAISNGELQRIRVLFRKPLDVRLEWLGKNDGVDQIAVYRQGFNDGKLIARRHGMLGSLVGTVHLDPLDTRALEDSRHPITEVGLGHVVGEVSRAMHGGQVTFRPGVAAALDGRTAVKFEFDGTAGARLFGVPGARRAAVWVDSELKLPVKVEIVDEAGTMLERHRFSNVHINVGLTDATFTL